MDKELILLQMIKNGEFNKPVKSIEIVLSEEDTLPLINALSKIANSPAGSDTFDFKLYYDTYGNNDDFHLNDVIVQNLVTLYSQANSAADINTQLKIIGSVASRRVESPIILDEFGGLTNSQGNGLEFLSCRIRYYAPYANARGIQGKLEGRLYFYFEEFEMSEEQPTWSNYKIRINTTFGNCELTERNNL